MYIQPWGGHWVTSSKIEDLEFGTLLVVSCSDPPFFQLLFEQNNLPHSWYFHYLGGKGFYGVYTIIGYTQQTACFKCVRVRASVPGILLLRDGRPETSFMFLDTATLFYYSWIEKNSEINKLKYMAFIVEHATHSPSPPLACSSIVSRGLAQRCHFWQGRSLCVDTDMSVWGFQAVEWPRSGEYAVGRS